MFYIIRNILIAIAVIVLLILAGLTILSELCPIAFDILKIAVLSFIGFYILPKIK